MNKIKNNLLVAIVFLLSLPFVNAQEISQDELAFITKEWMGERYEDGRPKVSEEILERIKNISIEEAWGVLRNKGYHNQFDGNWKMLHNDKPFVGRALTAQYMPLRPGIEKRMVTRGHNSDNRVGAMNSWPIDMLQKGDVYVADGYGKIVDGTLIGDNLGNAIYAKTGTGVVFDASSRDIEGLRQIDGFNAFVRDWDPSYLKESMLMGINKPIMIGRATVFPGDVVLAKEEGVIFIPAQFAEEVCINAEFVKLRDGFGIGKLKDGTYTPGQIDGRWSDDIKQAFLKWIDENEDLLPMSRTELDAYMKSRTW